MGHSSQDRESGQGGGTSDPTRRALLGASGLAMIGAGFAPLIMPGRTGLAASPKMPGLPADPSGLEPLNRFPRMVQEHFVSRLREIERAGNEGRAALKTRADAEQYVARIRERLMQCFGPFPERTPLNPRVTGTLKRDTYRVEKVIFESRPGFLVTGNLYVPQGPGPFPAVVGTCGHSANGKAAPPYQSFAQGLARQGYVVFIFDPLGQGERAQYVDAKLKSPIGMGVAEHLLAGNQQFLVGEFIGAWRAWDGMRALDYLLTRPEVDPAHVGVTGNSGGGTETAWLCAVEPRWTMAAPSCFITTFRRNVENELPADTEQCPPHALALGLDHSDCIAAMAPKPVILMSQEKDYFDTRGTAEAYARLKQLYTLLGKPDNIALFVGPDYHGYSIENREAMYHWFNRATGRPDAPHEPTLTLEKDEDLWCTPHGQVAELKSHTVPAYTAASSASLAKERGAVSGEALTKAVTTVLHLPPRDPASPPDFRILRTLPSRKYPMKHCVTYGVETGPGILALVNLLQDEPRISRPPRGDRATLYVAHQSSDVELRTEPLVAESIKADPKSLFYACDVRGIGESKPDTCGKDTFLTAYGSDYFYAIHSIMLDEPYVGRKTHDVLRVIDLLESTGVKEIHIIGKGWGAFPATFAALLSPRVTKVTLKNALTSYAAIAEAATYRWPLSTFAPGVLKHFDLPDCYRALAAKGLRQVDPWGPEAG